MSTNHPPSHPPSEPGSVCSDDWELVNDANSSDEGQSSSSCEFVKLVDPAVSSRDGSTGKSGGEEERGFENSTATVTEQEPEVARAEAVEMTARAEAVETTARAAQEPVPEVDDAPLPSMEESGSESIDVIPELSYPEESVDECFNLSQSPERVEEVYEKLRERLSERMSRESSSESEASDYVRLDRTPAPRMQQSDVMRASGSSISSRFSFIQHTDGEEDESLPESDISLLNEESAREESVLTLRPTNHPHYLHRPNPDLNFWLNVLVGVVLALAVGLGVGHAVGSSREVRNQRDIQMTHVDRIKTLQEDLVQCMKRADQTSVHIAQMEKIEMTRTVDEVRARLRDLEFSNQHLSALLDDRTEQVQSLQRRKDNLFYQLRQLRNTIDVNAIVIEKVSDEGQSRSEGIETELNEAKTRIDILEVRNTNLENGIPDLVELREQVAKLQDEKESLRKEVFELREQGGEGLMARMEEMERKNEELERKCDVVASQYDPNIRDEIKRLRQELEKERYIWQLWTSFLSLQNQSIPFLYQQFRTLLNTTNTFSSDLRDGFSSLSNSTVLNQFWEQALNSTQNLDQLPGMALNTSKDVFEFLSQTYEKVSEKTKKEFPSYLDKTKEKVNNIGKQIKKTWTKFKDLSIHESGLKGARKFKESVEGFGEQVASNVMKFTEKIKDEFSRNFRKEKKKKKHGDHERADENANKFSQQNRNSDSKKREFEHKKERFESRRERKMAGKFSRLREKIERMDEKSWLKMDHDDIEDLFQDLSVFFTYFVNQGLDELKPFLECQKLWFRAEYSREPLENCEDHLFEWQSKVHEAYTQEGNSTSGWYFRPKERDGDPEWYFKRVESRADSHHDPDWQFERAKQREKDRSKEKNRHHGNERFHDFDVDEEKLWRYGDELGDWD